MYRPSWFVNPEIYYHRRDFNAHKAVLSMILTKDKELYGETPWDCLIQDTYNALFRACRGFLSSAYMLRARTPPIRSLRRRQLSLRQRRSRPRKKLWRARGR